MFNKFRGEDVNNKKKLIILISIFSICCSFVFSAEVDQMNPDEPVADLGVYNDANSSAESDAVTKANEKVMPFILKNMSGTVLPFKCGAGSFKQDDTWGGVGLVFAKLGQDTALGFTAYYAVQNCVLFWDKNILKNVSDENEWSCDWNANANKMETCAWITLGCFVANNIASIVLPVVHHNIEKKDKSTAAAKFSSVSFYPVVTTEEYGAVAVLRF